MRPTDSYRVLLTTENTENTEEYTLFYYFLRVLCGKKTIKAGIGLLINP